MDYARNDKIEEAFKIIKSSQKILVFTGAGISVESGIPAFRGKGGLYEMVDPHIFDIEYFYNETLENWKMILKYIIFPLGSAKPNAAHLAITELQKKDKCDAIITQNIDGLHHKAGSKNIFEFHGTINYANCIRCNEKYDYHYILNNFTSIKFDNISDYSSLLSSLNKGEVDRILQKLRVPECKKCKGILKPSIVYFGEQIDKQVLEGSFYYAQSCDCLIIIGTSGVVYPAALIPQIAKSNNARIIEINTEESEYSISFADVFIKEKASIALSKLINLF
jgi:NAD-dependent deacetylase